MTEPSAADIAAMEEASNEKIDLRELEDLVRDQEVADRDQEAAEREIETFLLKGGANTDEESNLSSLSSLPSTNTEYSNANALVPTPTALIPMQAALVPTPTAVVPTPTAVVPTQADLVPAPTTLIPTQADLVPAQATSEEEEEEEEEEETESNRLSNVSVEIDPLAIGNELAITSMEYGYTVGRVVYRDDTLLRIMPNDATTHVIDFPLINGGTEFSPELDVVEIEVNPKPYIYYVDFLGVKAGDTLEFFTKEGNKARPPARVAEVIKTLTEDAVKLEDGTILEFNGVGPKDPIAIIRIHTGAITEDGENIIARQSHIDALLKELMPPPTDEENYKDRLYPDAIQREDMFQDRLSRLNDKQRKNVRKIRQIEREIDMFMSLKNTSIEYKNNAVIGAAPYIFDSLKDILIDGTLIPAAIPVVTAARILNLDDVNEKDSYNQNDVAPRKLGDVESSTATLMEQYLDDTAHRSLSSYLYSILSEDAQTLTGPTSSSWKEDQDIIRTDGLNAAVQALSINPLTYKKGESVISLAQLSSDTTDRYMRVLTEDQQQLHKYGRGDLIAPSDPSTIKGYVIIPTKAALSLRPPKRPGDLPIALIYSAALQRDNLPTVAEALANLYTDRDDASPLNAYTLDTETAGDISIATWLRDILKYAVHPVDSLGPRGPHLLSVLDTLGIGARDLSPAVYTVIRDWVAASQQMWRELLTAERARVRGLMESATRSFNTVTGDETTWDVLLSAAPLKELLTDVQSRNPTIFGSPTVLTSALLREAQGDAAPLVWLTLSEYDRRTLPDIDAAVATNSLNASRAYLLKRQVLRDFNLLKLHAVPEINTCPHVAKLEAIRNLDDAFQRSRLLREFVEQYQGGKAGDWITCVVCKQNCVCMHELMELEAISQPRRMEAIQKQILIMYGGVRYEGKIICKNCGQGLQEIDYDDNVEFDDNGNPIVQSSVLTEEQQGSLEDSVWRKSTTALVADHHQFTNAIQRDLAGILNIIAQEARLQIPDPVFRDIIMKSFAYLSVRMPSKEIYDIQYARASQQSRTTSKPIQMMPYEAIKASMYISVIAALTAVAIQISNPIIAVPSAHINCGFTRDGWPLRLVEDPLKETSGPMYYLACALSFIQKNMPPWTSTPWVGMVNINERKKYIYTQVINTAKNMFGYTAGVNPASFAPGLQTEIEKMRSNTEVQKAREMLSISDVLPAGFLPAPFPPNMSRPALERDPLPIVQSAIAAGKSVAPLIPPIAHALHQQAIAVVGELHEAAKSATRRPNATVCCPSTVGEAIAGQLLGAPEAMTLVRAGGLLHNAIPTAPAAGTHLWSEFQPPEPQPVSQEVDDSVLYKLFLKYCYYGPRVGDLHEFSAGNICRQCGLSLGKSPDTIDFTAEGKEILAAQLGPLHIDPTPAAFEALSGAVRRRKYLASPRPSESISWFDGLKQLATVAMALPQWIADAGFRLQAVLQTLDVNAQDMDAISRAQAWGPIIELNDQLLAYVKGQLTAGVNKKESNEAREALAMLSLITEDPFIRAPRTVQEYWCAKTEAAAQDYTVEKVNGAKWFSISPIHNEKLNKVLSDNANWYAGEITDGMRFILRKIGLGLGSIMRTWVRYVRPASLETGPWTQAEASQLLYLFILQSWVSAIYTGSSMYTDLPPSMDAATVAGDMVKWTRKLMGVHVRTQFMKYSKERVAQILQQRAELERTSVVQEFSSITDADSRAAFVAMKQLKIGRWAQGADIRKLDPAQFEAEVEQRHKMGIIDAPVDPTLLNEPQAGEDFGFDDLGGMPEDGYDANQAADGDDY